MRQPEMKDLEGRILNLDKIFKLEPHNQQIVMNLYHTLLDSMNGEKGPLIAGGIRFDVIGMSSTYNTLVEHDFLVTRREKNLDTLLC